jgi:hypothetical protein
MLLYLWPLLCSAAAVDAGLALLMLQLPQQLCWLQATAAAALSVIWVSCWEPVCWPHPVLLQTPAATLLLGPAGEAVACMSATVLFSHSVTAAGC